MTDVHIITGFLGAGKTTFINKLLSEGAAADGTILVENEFGDVSVDGDCIESDIQIMEISSGCICCSLQGNFAEGLTRLCKDYSPRQVFIEPTGMANLSDTLVAVNRVLEAIDGRLGAVITIVNAEAFPALIMMGGDFFRQQIEAAKYIVMSGTQELGEEELSEVKKLLFEINSSVPVRFEPWDALDALCVLEEAAAISCGDFGIGGSSSGSTGVSTVHGGISSGSGVDSGSLTSRNIRSESVFPHRVFTMEDAEELLSAFESGACGTVLRAKGFLRTSGYGMLHVEYVFGGRRQITPSDYKGESKFVIIGELAGQNKILSLFRCKYKMC